MRVQTGGDGQRQRIGSVRCAGANINTSFRLTTPRPASIKCVCVRALEWIPEHGDLAAGYLLCLRVFGSSLSMRRGRFNCGLMGIVLLRAFRGAPVYLCAPDEMQLLCV